MKSVIVVIYILWCDVRDTTTDVISYKYSLIVEGKKESRRGGRRRYIESDSESERREMGESQSGIYSTHNSLTCLSCDTRKSTTCPSHIHMRLFWQFENNVRGNKKKKLAFLLLHIFFAHSDTKVDFVFQVFFTVRSPVLVVCRCAPYSNVALPNVPFKVKYFSIFLCPTKAKGFYQFCRFFSPLPPPPSCIIIGESLSSVSSADSFTFSENKFL